MVKRGLRADMRDKFSFLGIKTPDRRAAQAPVFAELRPHLYEWPDEAYLVEILEALRA